MCSIKADLLWLERGRVCGEESLYVTHDNCPRLIREKYKGGQFSANKIFLYFKLVKMLN